MTSTTTPLKSTAFALMLALFLSGGLIGCATVSSQPTASLSLYQPPVLRLPAGTQVPTLDGIHTAQAPEVWHSDARFRHLEAQVGALTLALAQERSR